MVPDFEKMAKEWRGGPYVPRSEVNQFSGGMLHPRTMANLDSLGQGPVRVRYGKKVFYAVEELVKWGQQRVADRQAQ